MTSLPKLPDPDRTMWQYGKQIDHFTADQMQAYAQSCIDDECRRLKSALRRVVFEAASLPEARSIADSELSRRPD